MYRQYNVSVINIEANNGGEILARILKKRGLAVSVKKATKDKVTRLREYEGCFDRGEVYFLP
jgi:phage terminase large subunit-like protein